MRTSALLFLFACAEMDGVRPPPPVPTIQMVGDDLFIASPAERPTVDVQLDRVMIGFEHGAGAGQTAKFSVYDWDYNPVTVRERVSAERSNHIQVASSPWGWTLSWVRTGHERLSMRAVDLDGTPLQRVSILRGSSNHNLDYPDIHIDEHGQGLAIWSEDNVQGTTRYGLRTVDSTGLGAIYNRMDGLGHIGGPPCICGGEGARLVGWQAKSASNTAVVFQRVDDQGRPAEPAVIGDQATDALSRPACVHIDGGGWAVGWRSMDGRGVHEGTFLRFLEEDGTPRGPVQVIDPLGEGMALTAIGDDVLVAWRDYDSDGAGISAQMWSAASQSPTTVATRVNQRETGEQSSVDVGMWEDANGLHGLFSWHDGAVSPSRSIWGRAFTVVP